MRVTFYHNPRCSKSRQALELLRKRGVDPDIVLYLEQPPTKARLRELLRMLGIGPRELLRTGEDAYKSLKLSDPGLSDARLVEAMTANPILIERPIAVAGRRAVIGRPPERVLEILKEQ
jgi:arsenate reductase